MHTKLLIDSIVRQTTVLIAQLSASAGLRAPLAHIADEVFLSLSRELEEQGVSRKVVADMFGLALRSYQRRVHRLRGSATEAGTTLWQATVEFIQAEGPVTRTRLFERFRNDDPQALGAVLNDLVQSGLASRTENGGATLYAATTDEARRMLAREGEDETAAALVWLDLCRNPESLTAEVAGRTSLDEVRVERALERLRMDGRLTSNPGQPSSAVGMVIDVGAEVGWETAVFDHFQAVASAIAAKLRRGNTRSRSEDTTGGTTLTFEVSAEHPLREEVLGLLSRTRRETNEVWERCRQHNRRSPIPEGDVERVIFYFGQLVRDDTEQEA